MSRNALPVFGTLFFDGLGSVDESYELVGLATTETAFSLDDRLPIARPFLFDSGDVLSDGKLVLDDFIRGVLELGQERGDRAACVGDGRGEIILRRSGRAFM